MRFRCRVTARTIDPETTTEPITAATRSVGPALIDILYSESGHCTLSTMISSASVNQPLAAYFTGRCWALCGDQEVVVVPPGGTL